MLIVYSCDTEIIVTDSEHEAEILREWFIEGERDLEDYERVECETCIAIDAKMVLETS